MNIDLNLPNHMNVVSCIHCDIYENCIYFTCVNNLAFYHLYAFSLLQKNYSFEGFSVMVVRAVVLAMKAVFQWQWRRAQRSRQSWGCLRIF